MSTDNRVIELLVDMLHEVKDLKQEIKGVKQEIKEVKQEMKDVKQEQLRTTNAVWELSQMMQKVVAEPLALHASEIAHIKERLDRLEQSH